MVSAIAIQCDSAQFQVALRRKHAFAVIIAVDLGNGVAANIGEAVISVPVRRGQRSVDFLSQTDRQRHVIIGNQHFHLIISRCAAEIAITVLIVPFDSFAQFVESCDQPGINSGNVFAVTQIIQQRCPVCDLTNCRQIGEDHIIGILSFKAHNATGYSTF